MKNLFNKSKVKFSEKNKLKILRIVFILFFSVIAYKLVLIQILDAEKYKIAAKNQYQTKITLPSSRGFIYDRGMNILASNYFSISLAADPNMIEYPDSIAITLSRIFNKEKNYYLEKLTTRNTSFVFLERKIDPIKNKDVENLKYEGLIVIKDPGRIYNNGKLASQIVGFTDNENKGQSGIELSMNNILSGKDGYAFFLRDGKGKKNPSIELPQKDPINGNNLVLTIDLNIQKFIEEELSKGVSEFNADGGKVVVMSVKTGEILGMASYPTFDPNNIQLKDSAGIKNKIISDIYEPGSTFKIVTAAASLEENLENRNSIISTNNGIYESNGITIKDVHSSNNITFQQSIEQSSNVGMINIAQKLGEKRFYKYARDFGFGIYTGIELFGENKGSLKRPIDFSSISLAYMAIGYEVLVNALQMSLAYATIANNGLLMKPYIIKKELGTDGNIIHENSPTPIRQVVSEKTAKTLTSLLTGVVERGTGTDAQIKNVNIAGKTGTSQRLVDGKYSSNSHTSSFIGYFPAENPQVLITVIIDNPKSGSYYGGKVAAPIFRNIAEKIIDFTGVLNNENPIFLNISYNTNIDNTNLTSYDSQLRIPNLLNLKLKDAIEILKESNLEYEIIGENVDSKLENKFVETQSPSPNTMTTIDSKPKIKIGIRNKNNEDDKFVIVPDVRNISLRRAINDLSMEGFLIEINGSGKVVDVFPKPGTKQITGSKIILYCNKE